MNAADAFGVRLRLVGSAAKVFTPIGTHDMATKLDKPIKRELEHAGMLYTVTISPDGVRVVEKGKRKGRELSWESIISGDAELTEALKLSIDASREEGA
jgi:hypothetical protein